MKASLKKLCVVICAVNLVFTSMIAATAEETEVDYTEYYDLIIDRYEQLMIGEDGAIPLDTADEVLKEKMASISQMAREYYDSMEPKDTWSSNGTKGYIWADKETNIDLADNTSAEYNAVTVTARRAYIIALAYRVGESDIRGNIAYRDAALNIVDFITTQWYAPGIEQYGGWSNWQAQIPLPLYGILTLLHNEASQQLIDKVVTSVKYYPPQHAMLGTNLSSVSMVRLFTGAFGKDDYYIDWAKAGFETVADYVTAKDGIYYDGSFVQHNMYSYNGGYGVGLMDNNVDGPLLLLDTPWDISNECKQNLIEWVYSAYEPILYKGAVMEMTNGRFVAAQSVNNSYLNGSRVIKGILNLAEIAEDIDAAYFKRLVKYMFSEASSVYNLALECYDDTGRSQIYDYIGLYTKIKAILDDESLGERAPYIMSKVYYNTDRVVQHRADYSVGVSMHSNRIAGYESINGANLKGWYQGNSALWLYLDNNQFAETFFCTVDPYRLAGTTVLRGAAELPKDNDGKNSKGRNNYAGGTSILGQYAVSGHLLQPIGQTLSAKKSYFMFDNEIVALGTDITSTDCDDIETTIENRRLTTENGDNKFLVDGVETVTNLGDTATLTDMKWVHLEGNAENTSIGYYFPDGGIVNVLRETRTGSWADVDRGNAVDDETERTDNYLTMYINHGVTPENADYSYVLLPNATAEETEIYSANSDTVILANSSDVQAVTDTTLNVTGANFWNYKETTVVKDGADYITANAPATVMVAEDEENVTITVSDPTHENTGLIYLEVNVSAAEVVSKAEEITVLQTSPSIVLAIDPTEEAGYVGETMEIVLKKGENPDSTEIAPTISHENDFTIVAKETVAQTSQLEITGTRPYSISVENISENANVTVDRFGKLYIGDDIPLGKYSFDVVVANSVGTATQTFNLLVLSNVESKTPSKSVIYYDFNEGWGITAESNTTTTNYSGALDFNATLSDSVEWVDGFVGTALKFDSVSDTLSMNNATGYNYDTIGMNPKNSNFGGATEYDFWVKFDSKITSEQVIFSKIGNTTPYAVKVTADGKLGFCIRNSWYYSENTLCWNVGEWYHINIVHSYNAENTPAYNVTLKRDGITVGDGSFSNDINGVTSILSINANSKYTASYFNGTIDELYLGAVGGGEEIRLRSKVSFETSGGAEIAPQYVDLGGTATQPESPTKDGYIFIGWLDEDGNAFDFTTAINTDITVYAGFVDADSEYAEKITANVTSNNNVVLYYGFNDGYGTTVSRLGRSSIDGKDYGATVSPTVEWVDGFVGSAVRFTSARDYLALNSAANQQGYLGMDPKDTKLGNKEYDFWIKFNEDLSDWTADQLILGRDHNTKIPWAIKVTATGAISFNWADEWIDTTETLDWRAGEWYHINIVNTYDSANAANPYTITVTRDGNVVGNPLISSKTAWSSSGRVMYINGYDPIYALNRSTKVFVEEAEFFNGTIDELYLGKAGTAQDIYVRHKVSFNSNGGEYAAPAYVWNGETVAETTPTRDGYIFEGWYTDAECTTAYDFTTAVTADTTLYAKWTEIKLGDANGDGEVATEDLVLLRQYLLGTLETEIADIILLDVNESGAVDLKDLVYFKKYFAGLVTLN